VGKIYVVHCCVIAPHPPLEYFWKNNKLVGNGNKVKNLQLTPPCIPAPMESCVPIGKIFNKV